MRRTILIYMKTLLFGVVIGIFVGVLFGRRNNLLVETLVSFGKRVADFVKRKIFKKQ